MVLEVAQLVEAARVGALLEVEQVEVVGEGSVARQPAVEHGLHVIGVLDVEGAVGLGVGGAVQAAPAHLGTKLPVDRLGQPDAPGTDLLARRACPLPELDGDERRHVAAEAIHQPRPAHERLDLVVPQGLVARVVKVDDVGPVAHMVAGFAVRAPVEPLGVRLPQHGVGRGVVVHNVDHALHALVVDGVDQRAEVIHGAVLGVDGAVVAVGVRRPQRALAGDLPDGVDGHEPDGVDAQRANARQVGDEGAEGSLWRVVAHEDRVDDGLLQARVDGV